MGDNLQVSTSPDIRDSLELIPGPYRGGLYIVEGEDEYNYIQILRYFNRTTGIIRRNLTSSESVRGLDREAIWGCFYFYLVNGRSFQLDNREARRALIRSFRRKYRRIPTLRDLADYDIPRRGRDIICPPNSYPILTSTSFIPVDSEDQSDYEEISDTEEDLTTSVDESPEA